MSPDTIKPVTARWEEMYYLQLKKKVQEGVVHTGLQSMCFCVCD